MFLFDDVIMVKCVHYHHFSMYFPSCISTENKCQLNRTQAYCEMCIGIFTHPHTQRTSVTTVYPKKCAHGFCFAVLCCGYTLTDFTISIRLTSLSLWQSNDCPSASKATLMNMDKYFMWINFERLHNHNKAKHNKTVCIFHGIYCTYTTQRDKAWIWLIILTHLPLMPHLCVIELSQQWSRQWLVACSAPSYYLNQLWAIVNWTLKNKLN